MKVVKEGNTVVRHIHIDDLSTTSVGDIEDSIFDKNQIDHEVVLFVGANVLDSSCLLAHYADAIAAACYMIRAVVVHLPRGGSLVSISVLEMYDVSLMKSYNCC